MRICTLEIMGEIVRIKHFSKEKNDDIFQLIDQKRLKGYCWETDMTLFEWKVTRNYYKSLFKVQRNKVMHLKTNRLYCVERERNPLGIQSTRLKEDAWRLQLANWQLVLYILIHSSYINQGLEPRFKVSIIGCSIL